MENKYYTPELSEFHVGFECEMKNSSDPIHFDWEKCIFKNDFSNELNEDYCFEYLYNDLKDGNIRVKHLDREDIESLGWEFIKKHPGTESHDFELKSNNEMYLSVDFDFRGKIHLRIYDGECDSEFNYFSGTIKNKSELRKLIQQLNINSGGK